MSESVSIDEGWQEPLDSDQVTHVKGEPALGGGGAAATGEWLVNVSEQVVVPMTTADVVEALRSRRITERSLVWRAGMQDWAALGDVPQLRLAAGSAGATQRIAPAPVRRLSPAPVERVAAPASDRMLHPPPKEPARAARDERIRRSTLPFGFPVVRDPATIREPAGLHLHSAPAPAAQPARAEDVEALAIYERATPSLTFSDSVRAEWQGTSNLVHQPAPTAPSPVPVSARPARTRPEPRLETRPETRRLSLEPQSDRKPRLSLEPQSDPMQSARPEPLFKLSGSQPSNSLAPTTSEPENPPPARGAGLWGDLSVVLASDLRAVQASSKRVTLIASLGSAALASLLTLWFAHSSTQHPSERTVAAAQAAPSAPPPKTETVTAPPVLASPVTASAERTSLTVGAAAHSAAAPGKASVARAIAKPALAAPPRVATRPKQTPDADESPTATDAPTTTTATDNNPYGDPSEHTPPKTPTAAFKEPNQPAQPEVGPGDKRATLKVSKAPNGANAASGLEDNAPTVRTAPTAAPGF